jgi:hypothetical protein
MRERAVTGAARFGIVVNEIDDRSATRMRERSDLAINPNFCDAACGSRH